MMRGFISVFSLILGASAPGLAEELAGERFRLIPTVVRGGGGIDLRSSSRAATRTAQGVLIGQPSPLGRSSGTSGVVLETGFWPATAVPEPSPTWMLLLAGRAFVDVDGDVMNGNLTMKLKNQDVVVAEISTTGP